MLKNHTHTTQKARWTKRWGRKEIAKMTREEAIQILQRKTTIPNDGESFDDICEAFNMAISALKKEPLSVAKNEEKKLEWTRVEDRLPIDDDEKLITVERKDGYAYTTIGIFHPDIKRWSFATLDFYFFDEVDAKVVAWAPVPKPFVTDRKE